MVYSTVRDALKRAREGLERVKGAPAEAYDLKNIRGNVDYALKKVEDALSVKSNKWKCSSCGHVANFSRPVAKSAAVKCTRCGRSEFEPSV